MIPSGISSNLYEKLEPIASALSGRWHIKMWAVLTGMFFMCESVRRVAAAFWTESLFWSVETQAHSVLFSCSSGC